MTENMVVTCPECGMPVVAGDPFLEDSGEIYHAGCLNDRDEREAVADELDDAN